MKIGQVIEHNNRNILLQKSYRKGGKETSFQASFCLSEKIHMREKQVVCSLVSIYLDSPHLDIQWKQVAQNFRQCMLTRS